MKRYDLNLCGLGLDNAVIQSPLFCNLSVYTFSTRKANLRPIVIFYKTLARFMRVFRRESLSCFQELSKNGTGSAFKNILLCLNS